MTQRKPVGCQDHFQGQHQSESAGTPSVQVAGHHPLVLELP